MNEAKIWIKRENKINGFLKRNEPFYTCYNGTFFKYATYAGVHTCFRSEGHVLANGNVMWHAPKDSEVYKTAHLPICEVLYRMHGIKERLVRQEDAENILKRKWALEVLSDRT